MTSASAEAYARDAMRSRLPHALVAMLAMLVAGCNPKPADTAKKAEWTGPVTSGAVKCARCWLVKADVGSVADNLKLSEARAAAVKAALVAGYGIETARLSSRGFGSATPVAPNTTPEGRQNNRRVELVKI